MGWEQVCIFAVGCPAKLVPENAMRLFLTCLIDAVGLAIVGFGPPAAAESLKSVVGALNAIVNPEDAWGLDPDEAHRLPDQARRFGRSKAEQYWGGIARASTSDNASPVNQGWVVART
jgi:hypothetical protein